MPLLDRREELGEIDRLLAAMREGLSGALVLRGEPGIGKTALLDYVAEAAHDMQVARVVAVESEMALGFASLHQLLVPFLPRMEGVPAPQRSALRTVFGLAAGPPPDRFIVGLGVLTLLAVAASPRPLLCIIDDAQWLDRESADVLAFVARRLYADRVGLVFAVREPVDPHGSLQGLPELRVAGLPEREARELLSFDVIGPLDDRVGDRIMAEANGNPLALTEFVRELSAAELAGDTSLPDPLPAGRGLEERFLRQVRALPENTQTLMLLAAADPSGDPALLRRATASEDLGLDAAYAAETSGLLVLAPAVAFRHPLIRSAVYYGCSLAQRRRAHQVLATVSDPEVDPDRRAWHRAAATIGADEGVAGELERSAARAQLRGGYAAAAAFHERAAQLTADGTARAQRMLVAASAHLEAGSSHRAQALLEEAAPGLDDPLRRAQAQRLRGMIRFARGEMVETPAILLDAARALEPFEATLARDTLLVALFAAQWAGRLATGAGLRDVARAIRAAPPRVGLRATPSDLLLDGFAALLTVGRADGTPVLRESIAELLSDELDPRECLRAGGPASLAALELVDYEAAHALASRHVRLAREHRALNVLPTGLVFLAWTELLGGRFPDADSLLIEARELAAASGAGRLGAGTAEVMLSAWRGVEEPARAAAAELTADSAKLGQGIGLTGADSALSVLELGLGNYDAALALNTRIFHEDPPPLGILDILALPNMVEAAVRAGEPAAAGLALRRLLERAAGIETDWARGIRARAMALTTADSDADAETLYREALQRLGRCRVRTEYARAELLYGEWLRRRTRRRDAREHLRTAHETFEAMGAGAFAERARVELAATGEAVGRRTVQARDELSPQEAQIARLAAEGASNAEIAGQLFLSPSTIAYHLQKVFRKLGVHSRNQLAHALRAGKAPALAELHKPT